MKIHYFQRYHSKENVVTANSMLLLSRLYTYSSVKFYKFLKTSIFPGVDIELTTSLQEKSEGSVPDATISQDSFKIVIETKLYDQFSSEQLERHTKAFGSQMHKVLLSLSKNGIPDHVKTKLDEFLSKENAKKQTSKILHKHLTFESLINEVREVLDDRDYEMLDVLEDFSDFCYDEKLIPDAWKWLRVRAVGTTVEANRELNLYYDSAYSRGLSGFDFLGLYKDKSVRAVGRVVARISAVVSDGEVVFGGEINKLTDDIKDRIKKAIIDAEQYGYDLANVPHVYFVVDNFYETNFEKQSKGGLWGQRTFNLEKEIGKNLINKSTTAEKIASLLNGKTWE